MESTQKRETNEQLDDNNAVLAAARHASIAARILSGSSSECRTLALKFATEELLKSKEEILAANVRDMEAAQLLVAEKKLSPSLLSRLKLDAEKFKTIVEGIDTVSHLPEPLGRSTLSRELDDGLELHQISCPIGLIAVIFESRPDALPQIASLCIKSGNAAILKGGKEAKLTNQALFKAMQRGVERADLPKDSLMLVDDRKAIEVLLKADRYVDLVVPRGSNDLVRYIQNNTRIPVLGHADGLCHLYVDSDADLNKALRIAVDAKTQYPAACNSIETLLLHESISSEFLDIIVPALLDKNVEIRCDSRSMKLLRDVWKDKVLPASLLDWETEYCELIIAVKVVSSMDEAIEHINYHGSHHTETIVTEKQANFERFFSEINSAGVFWNASTRFADGFRYGFGAEVGISTGKLHPRGPVGLDGLVTYKYKLIGDGHIVADYTGGKGRTFSHRNLKTT